MDLYRDERRKDIELGIRRLVDMLDCLDDFMLASRGYGNFADTERKALILEGAKYSLIIRRIIDEFLDIEDLAKITQDDEHFNLKREVSLAIINARNDRYRSGAGKEQS